MRCKGTVEGEACEGWVKASQAGVSQVPGHTWPKVCVSVSLGASFCTPGQSPPAWPAQGLQSPLWPGLPPALTLAFSFLVRATPHHTPLQQTSGPLPLTVYLWKISGHWLPSLAQSRCSAHSSCHATRRCWVLPCFSLVCNQASSSRAS